MDLLTLVIILVIGFIVAFSIGSNDEAMAPAVGAKVFSVRAAVLIGGFITIIGAVFLGGGVSEKVGSDLVFGEALTPNMVFSILISMAIWLLVASATKGLPISTTQCIVGSVIGVVAAAPLLGHTEWGVFAVDWYVVGEIFAGWILSPVIGFIFSALVFAGVRKIQSRAKGLSDIERQEKIAAYGLALFLILTSMSRGGNDVANAVAPLLSIEEFQMTIDLGFIMVSTVIVPLLVGGIGMALGLIVIGRKVVRTLANEVVSLSPSSALSASISVFVVMFVGTLWGFPLSGTHVLVAALIAVGWVANKPIQMKQVKEILISWIITIPIAGGLAVGVFWMLDFFSALLL